MNSRSTILSAEEAKKIMQKNLKPIISQHKKSHNNISTNAVLKSTYWATALFSIIMLIGSLGQVMEAHSIIEKPAMSVVKERTDFTPSRGTIRVPEMGHYNAMEKSILRSLGNKKITVDNKTLVRYDLPDGYYNNINFSLFNALNYYDSINSHKKFSGLHIIDNGKLSIDENGFMRHNPDRGQFKLNQSDYVITTQTISEKDIYGSRYLVITDVGMYTIITDDDKDSDVSPKYIPRFSGLKGSNTCEQVYNFLRIRGCSHEAAIGILANMHQESGISADKHQTGGPAKGILQWEGGRFNRLVEFADQNGRDWTDLECQLEFLWIELNSRDMNERMKGTSGFASNLNRHGINGHPQGFEGFKNTNNAEYATALFEGSFERAGIPMMQNRYNALPALNERLKNIKVKKPSGLLKVITSQGSNEMSNATLRPAILNNESTKVLRSKILCIYKIE